MTIQVSTEAELLAEGRTLGLAIAKEEGLSGKFAERFATGFATSFEKAFVKSFMEASEKTAENIAMKLIKAGIHSLEEIAEACELPIQRVQELAKTN